MVMMDSWWFLVEGATEIERMESWGWRIVRKEGR